MANELDRDDEKPEETKAAPPSSNKKLLLIIGAAAAAVLLVVCVVVVIVLRRGDDTNLELRPDILKQADQGIPEGAADEDELAEGEKPLGAIFPLDSFAVNLSGDEKRFLRCQIQVEFDQRDVPRKFYRLLVPIKDAVLEHLSQQDPKDLATVKGRADLRDQVRELINEKLKKEDVRSVYFTQFLMQ